MTNSAFCSSNGKVTFFVTLVAYAILVLAVPRAYAQGDGPCCDTTAIMKTSCQSTGCSARSFQYTYCSVPLGDNSKHWKVATVKCCLSEFQNFVAPSGGSQGCDDNASKPLTPLDAELYAGGVWVRTCVGKYVFVTRPS
jgi:hypothetical protein